MNKRYVLPNGDEIIDCSGVKTVEQLAAEFNKPVEDLVETPEPSPDPTQAQLDNQSQEQLIQDKMRSMAVDALISDGTLEMTESGPALSQSYKMSQLNKQANGGIQ